MQDEQGVQSSLALTAKANGGGGNVGIGTTTPGFPLSFADVLGDKISLWGQAGNHYGFGIQPSLLQIHTDFPGSDIAFGSGSSAAFMETMRIKGNGNVGIRTAAPGFPLDVVGRSRFREGGGSAGLWFHQGGGDRAFIGLTEDGKIGFWGNTGAGWSMTLNTTDGTVQLPAGRNINCQGRLHISGDETLYLLNRAGVIVGREWGGNGNLWVQGDLAVGGALTVNSRLVVNAPINVKLPPAPPNAKLRPVLVDENTGMLHFAP